MSNQGIIQRYQDLLPPEVSTTVVTLQEGNTPLIPLLNQPVLQQHNIKALVKFEGLNPTGSFKDRGMTAAISHAKAQGAKAVVCASTGNTSAAAAAYAARAGMACFVLIPSGKIATGKLAQAIMHGAHIIQLDGNFDQGMAIVKQLAEQLPLSLVNSVNPYRLQGQKTAAFEIVDALGRAPDYHCLPVGNAGNITAYWMGYQQYQALGRAATPVMCGYQAAGAAPLVRGEPIAQPETIATAIRIGNPQSWQSAETAVQASQGWFDALSDELLLQAQYELARTEGVFCEPASAISIAGMLQDVKSGKIAAGSTVVCTLTGVGLKDPDIANRYQSGIITVDAEYKPVAQLISERINA